MCEKYPGTECYSCKICNIDPDIDFTCYSCNFYENIVFESDREKTSWGEIAKTRKTCSLLSSKGKFHKNAFVEMKNISICRAFELEEHKRFYMQIYNE